MSAIETLRYTEAPLAPRVLNALLGAWLFASTFLWRHSNNAGLNDWLVGLLVLTTALMALYAPKLRWTSTLLAAGLAFGALAFSYPTVPARLHDLALAGMIGALSLAPARIERDPERLAA
jgi:hypothetical protein